MEGHVEIITLIHQGILPKIRQAVPNPTGTLKTLVDQLNTLNLEQLQALKPTLNQSVPENSKRDANNLLAACICNAILDADPFTAELGRSVLPMINALKEIDNFNTESAHQSLLSNVLKSIGDCTSAQEIDLWVAILDSLKNVYGYTDIETERKWAENKYTELVWDNIKNEDPVKLAEQLIITKRLEENGFDISFLKSIVIDFSYDYIEQKDEQNTPDGIKELLAVLLNFTFDDEDKTQKVNQWKVKYNVVPASTTPNQSASSQPAFDGFAVPAPIINPDRLIQYSSELELIQPPFYSYNYPERYIVSVYRGFANLPSRTEVAVKVYTLRSSNEDAKLSERIENINREIEIISDLSGKDKAFLNYYGRYHEVADNQKSYGFVMEYCTKTLMDEITSKKEQNNPYTEKEIYDISVSLLSGFAILESKKICHQDIKPHNIFINSQGILKIADFNISKRFDQSATTLATGQHYIQGTTGYMSPELRKALLEGKLLGQGTISAKFKPVKADVFSLGLTLLQLYTLQTVENFSTPEGRPALEEVLANIPYPWLRTSLAKMLDKDYKFRPKFKHVLSAIVDDQSEKTRMV